MTGALLLAFALSFVAGCVFAVALAVIFMGWADLAEDGGEMILTLPGRGRFELVRRLEEEV